MRSEEEIRNLLTEMATSEDLNSPYPEDSVPVAYAMDILNWVLNDKGEK